MQLWLWPLLAASALAAVPSDIGDLVCSGTDYGIVATWSAPGGSPTALNATVLSNVDGFVTYVELAGDAASVSVDDLANNGIVYTVSVVASNAEGSSAPVSCDTTADGEGTVFMRDTATPVSWRGLNFSSTDLITDLLGSPRAVDFDFDGVTDLMFAAYGNDADLELLDGISRFFFFRNNGTNAAPDFALVDELRYVSLGGSYQAAADAVLVQANGTGALDLAYTIPTTVGVLVYDEVLDDSVSGTLPFKYVETGSNTNWPGLAVGDLDNNTYADLLIATKYRLHLYSLSATDHVDDKPEEQPAWLDLSSLGAPTFSESRPTLFDADDDADLDLLVFEGLDTAAIGGSAYLCNNTGNVTTPVFNTPCSIWEPFYTGARTLGMTAFPGQGLLATELTCDSEPDTFSLVCGVTQTSPGISDNPGSSFALYRKAGHPDEPAAAPVFDNLAITLSWTAPARAFPPVEWYELWIRDADNSSVLYTKAVLDTTALTGNVSTPLPLDIPPVNVTASIVSVNSAGSSRESPSSERFLIVDAPGSLTCEQFSLSWETPRYAGAFVTSYVVYVDGEPFTTIDSGNSGSVDLDGSVGLFAGVAYNFSIASVTFAGTSAQTEPCTSRYTLDPTIFVQLATASISASCGEPSVVDVDEDGSLDLACTSGDTNAMSFFRNTGSTATPVFSASSWGTIDVTADFVSGDFFVDSSPPMMVAALVDDSVETALLNVSSEATEFTNFVHKDPSTDVESLRTGDVDGDSADDTVWVSVASSTLYWSSSFNFSYPVAAVGVSKVASNTVAVCDVDGNGFADVVLDDGSALWLNNGTNKFAESSGLYTMFAPPQEGIISGASCRAGLGGGLVGIVVATATSTDLWTLLGRPYDVVSAPTAVGDGNGFVDVSWEEAAFIDGPHPVDYYEVQLGDEVRAAQGTELRWLRAAPNVDASFSVRAVNAAGSSVSWSPLSAPVVPNGRPGALDTLEVQDAPDAAVAVWWTAPVTNNDTITNYTLHWDGELFATVDGAARTHTLSPPPAWTSANVTVVAHNPAGAGLESTVVATRVIPAAPVALSAPENAVALCTNHVPAPFGSAGDILVLCSSVGDFAPVFVLDATGAVLTDNASVSLVEAMAQCNVSVACTVDECACTDGVDVWRTVFSPETGLWGAPALLDDDFLSDPDRLAYGADGTLYVQKQGGTLASANGTFAAPGGGGGGGAMATVCDLDGDGSMDVVVLGDAPALTVTYAAFDNNATSQPATWPGSFGEGDGAGCTGTGAMVLGGADLDWTATVGHPFEVPGVPVATPGSPGQMLLSWEPADGNGLDIAAYAVQVQLNDSDALLLSSATEELLLTGLLASTVVTFNVSAVTDAGVSPIAGTWSAPASVSSSAGAPTVSSLTCVAGDEEVVVSWTVDWRGAEPTDVSVDGNTTGLVNGVEYTFAVLDANCSATPALQKGLLPQRTSAFIPNMNVELFSMFDADLDGDVDLLLGPRCFNNTGTDLFDHGQLLYEQTLDGHSQSRGVLFATDPNLLHFMMSDEGHYVYNTTTMDPAGPARATESLGELIVDAGSVFAFGDVDGDGQQDAATLLQNRVYFFRNAGGEELELEFGSSNPFHGASVDVSDPQPMVELCDMDGDGMDDLAILEDPGRLRLFFASGGYAEQTGISLASDTTIFGLSCVRDFYGLPTGLYVAVAPEVERDDNDDELFDENFLLPLVWASRPAAVATVAAAGDASVAFITWDAPEDDRRPHL